MNSQAERALRITTELGPEAFMLVGLEGREAISQPFELRLNLLSEDPAVDTAGLLRTPVVVEVDRGEADDAFFHGRIRRVRQLGTAQGLTSYQLEVVPEFWFLGLATNCRIFQEKTVVEIVKDVLSEHGHSPPDIRVQDEGPVREFCVQYRETDLDFLSRLLEEEGIHYFFEHSAGGHTLVLSDQSPLAPDCDGGDTPMQAAGREQADAVGLLSASHGVHTGSVALRDFDFEQAPRPLDASVQGEGNEEAYDYHPGRFTAPDGGERYAKLALEAEEAGYQGVEGEGSCRHFRSGHRFDLSGHYRGSLNAGYLLTSVRHRAEAGEWRSDGEHHVDYEVLFEAMPVEVRYRPPRITPRPRIHGTQTALVVGPSGEEIWVDKYGRVKVKFPWDRSEAKDETASCWVRVSTSWAGKNWGAIQLPRIGEEVIVGFLEGDPDRPLVIGRVYNADHMPPYPLPDQKTKSGVKSRSTREGSTSTFNEIRFEDLKGKEELYIHAEKNKVVMVENDRTETVGNNETITVKNDRTETVEANESITIGEDRSEAVGGKEVITIAKTRSRSVGKDDDLSVDGSRSVSVGKDDALTVSGKISVDASGAISITSNRSIELKVGANSILVDTKGVVIKGTKISVEGTASAEIKALSTKVKGTVSAEVSGTMVEVKGSAMLKLQGAITMIN